MALLLCALCLFVASALLGLQAARQWRARQLVARRLQGQMAREERLGDWLHWLGSTALGRRLQTLDGETQALLDRVGWRRSRQRALFAAVQLGLPLLAVGMTLLLQHGLVGEGPGHWLVLPLCALGVGYLLPKRLLAVAAQRRQQRIALEVSLLIPLLRILFETGLAVEQALRVLSQEGRGLLPEISEELRLVLQRVDSGLALGPELEKSAHLLAVDEFIDTCVILRQLLVQGSGGMKSLQALKALLDDRRLTRLQERVSKMSAKMSAVMMLFLFPALLIVLAGPGFTALARALGS
ncbi:type II secretion system F family protein [Pseudomonas guariconensis]|uniref:type II secretion system F family protein n=1 Tax=Pseudomonas TaxID=286 RepID=UPI001CE46759|nr:MULTISPECIES: type II secretion system F family protein [Pseudomonas]MCO7639273.1 type II secretion system F family protein [Pseudomonas sp. S 311-6]MCO7516121.1 type II secretion system F family protein [Pseudomonas putida]MCO7565360.1 type II secretion system F family protein [Pseudomonas mosselii]MCO7594522.1 type II secretion system F family protein [Pseudomonas guariconensis]MCO7607573.1 type II secretion system F family protein [Pseudomonas guariconensis]